MAQIKGVNPHFGDSRDILRQIVKDIGERSAVFWLDGHWSGGETAGEFDECPILGELECLASRADDIILIDDARLFLCAPPLPHNPSQWATISDILGVVSQSNKKPFVQIIDDVIFITSDKDAVRNHLVEYAQKRSEDFWREFGNLQRGKQTAKTRLGNRLSKIWRG